MKTKMLSRTEQSKLKPGSLLMWADTNLEDSYSLQFIVLENDNIHTLKVFCLHLSMIRWIGIVDIDIRNEAFNYYLIENEDKNLIKR